MAERDKPAAASQLKLGSPVTQQQVSAAIALKKAITGRTIWSAKSNPSWVESQWLVRHEMAGVQLKMVASVNVRAPEKHTATVLWNDVRVAGVCVMAHHTNKHTDRATFGWGAHEHVWTDECNATWCREVDAMPGGVREVVEYMCNQFGIQFAAEWSDPPISYQVGLVQL